MSNEEKIESSAEETEAVVNGSASAEEPESNADENASAEEATDAGENASVNAAETSAEGGVPAEESAEAANMNTSAESAENIADKDESKPEKAKKARPVKQKRRPAGMSKLFKLIYYPVMAVAALIVMIFSFIDGVCGYSPEEYKDTYYDGIRTHINALAEEPRSAFAQGGISSARDYIVSELVKGGFVSVDEQKDGVNEDSDDSNDDVVTTVTGWGKIDAGIAPTVTVMTSQPSAALQKRMGADEFYVGGEITDIIAALPSAATRKAALDASYKEKSKSVIVTVRYDSRPDNKGAADNAAFVAVAIEALKDYARRDVKLNRDLIVVFTEEQDSAFGVYTFFESFKGLDGAVSRASVGVSLDAYGNSGTLALTDYSGAGLDYINAYTKISGNTFNSSLVPDSIPDEIKTGSAVGGFGDVPAIQVSLLGGLDAAASVNDTASAVSDGVIKQESAFFKNYVDAFAVEGQAVEKGDGSDSAVFSYFDWGTVAYNPVASYVIGVFILALIGASIAVMAVKKTFSVKKLFIALGVELLVLAGSLAAMYAAYFLVTLMLTGFGVLPIHAITQLRYFNAGILIAAIFISVAAAFGFSTLFKKLLKVTSSDTVRGTALLFGLVGAIMSFASPAYSYITSIIGLLLCALLLVTSCLNVKLKERFGIGFDRLFVYVIPVIICMPFMLSAISMLTELLPLTMLPLTMLLFTGMIGTAVPYLDRTVTLFDKVAKKLPMRTQRVEHTVTERVEDRAKKGKFTERQVKRVDKEKVAVNYKNYFGVSLLAVIGCVTALFSGGFGALFGQTITTATDYDRALYNDSIVYEWEKTSSGTSQKIVIGDLIAYKYIRYAVDGLEWDAVNGCYYKNVNYATNTIFTQEPSVTRDVSTYTVTSSYYSLSSVKLTFSSASAVTSITVKPISPDKQDEGLTYEFFNEDEIVLRLPCGYADGRFTLEFKGGNPTNVSYEEELTVDNANNPLDQIDEWNNIVNEYRGQDVLDGLRGGIVLKRSFTL